MKKGTVFMIVLMLLFGAVGVSFASGEPYLTDSEWDLSVNGSPLPLFEREGTHYVKLNMLHDFGLKVFFNEANRTVQVIYDKPQRGPLIGVKDKKIRSLVRIRIGKAAQTDLKILAGDVLIPGINVKNEMYVPVSALSRWGQITKNTQEKTYAVTFQAHPEIPLFLNVDYDKELYKFKSDHLYGFVNAKEQFVIEPIFDDAKQFEQGLAAVKQNGKWGYINQTGQLMIPCTFDTAGNFNAHTAVVTKNTQEGQVQYGLIDKKGKIVLDFFIGQIRPFKEGLAAISIGIGQNEKWGFIDEKGKMIISPDYLLVRDFNEGYTAVMLTDGTWAFMDEDGHILNRDRYDYAAGYGSGLFLVETGRNSYYSDRRGDTKIGLRDIFGQDEGFEINWRNHVYDESFFRGFEEDVAVYRILGRDGAYQYGLMDDKGNVIKDPFANEIGPFKEGFAIVRFGDESTGKYGLIDKKGEILVTPIYDYIENVYQGKIFAILKGQSVYIKR